MKKFHDPISLIKILTVREIFTQNLYIYFHSEHNSQNTTQSFAIYYMFGLFLDIFS